MLHVRNKNSFLSRSINKLEEEIAVRCDVLITVGERLLSTFKAKPRKCALVLNCAKEVNVSSERPNDDILTLVYIGPIVRGQALDMVERVLQGIERVELQMAGRPTDQTFLETLLKIPNVKYLGLLLPKESIELAARCDVMLAIYDPSRPQNEFAMPNKLFESLLCGIPIITNVAADIIKKENCGLLVQYDVDDIRKAIIKLRDDASLRSTLGKNARSAFLNKYNWNFMEKNLYQIYDELLAISGDE